jgi:hypothetical protein
MSAQYRNVGWRDHLVGVALCVAYVALLLATSSNLGMARDEGFYVVAAENYATWFELLWDDSSAALEQGAIDPRWRHISEHPSLMKSAFALSWLAHQKWEIFDQPSMAFRFPGMLTGGLLLWLIYIFGARAYGRQAGAFAALSFAMMPRVFYNSHLDCFDIPIAFMLMLVTYCYWRSLSDSRWAIWTGIAYGLALETKHNAWILPIILITHWLFVVFTERRARKAGAKKRTSYVPWWLIAMLTLGPPIFIGLWPWMWFDTLHVDFAAERPVTGRLADYVAFHINHEYYNMAYFGVNYFRPPFPMSYSWVMTLFTVPLVTIALALSGVGVRLRALIPPGLMERVWPKGKAEPDPARTDVLAFGSMIGPLVVMTLPSTPIFGGTKHWITAYPYLCLFAGISFVAIGRAARRLLDDRVKLAKYGARVAAGCVLLAPSALETLHSHPFGIAHYTFAAGGTAGAADYGMNRQFWGYTTGSLVDYFEREMPEGGTVYICDTTATAWQMLQRDGRLDSRIRATGDLIGADYAIVHHEHHFVEVDYQIWAAYGSVRPVHVLRHYGVPIISVYENPRHAARRDAAPANARPTQRSVPVR